MLDILFIVALLDAILVILPVLIPSRWCNYSVDFLSKEYGKDKKNKEYREKRKGD